MTIESTYTHYIYCWDCHAWNEPKRLKMNRGTFMINLLKFAKRLYKPEAYDAFVSDKENLSRHKPEDYFLANGLHCLSCGSQNYELKCLNTLPMVYI